MNTLASEFAEVISQAVKHHSDVFNKTDWAKVPVETFFVGGLKIDLETLKLIECANVVYLLGGTAEFEVQDERLAKYLQQYFPHFQITVQNIYTWTTEDSVFEDYRTPLYERFRSNIPSGEFVFKNGDVDELLQTQPKPPLGDIRKTVVEKPTPEDEQLQKTWERLLYGYWPKT